MAGFERKRVLLACFSCSPQWGSEPGVGWNWLRELSRMHDVTLVTHAFYRSHLEPELDKRPLQGVDVVYCNAFTAGIPAHRYLNSRLYYVWWQLSLYRRVSRLVRARRFDVIHHLTWGTVRFPSFLGFLNVPFVTGPLGGGDVAPSALLEGLPARERLFERFRAATMRLSRLDPITSAAMLKARLILCKTDATRDCLPARARGRAELAFEIGSPAPASDPEARVHTNSGPLRLLFAGRLIGLKGLSLAIGTVARLRQRGVDVTLEIAGDGPLRRYLEERIRVLGLCDCVSLLGMLPRAVLLSRYSAADIFFFPSLRDASGNVVLEALSRGLPVVCLDLGGPKHYVDETCGVVVRTAGRTRNAVEEALADVLQGLAADREMLQRLSHGAHEHSIRQTWASRVEIAYARIGQALGWDNRQ